MSTTSNIWSDQYAQGNIFSFELKESYDGYFGVDFYNPRMYAEGCRNGSTSADVMIILNGKRLSSFKVYDTNNYGYLRNTWTAGKYQVVVSPSWLPNDVRDYAFRTFLPSAAKFSITQTSFTSAADRLSQLSDLLFTESLLSPYDLSDKIGFTYKVSYLKGTDAFQFGYKGVAGKTCSYSTSLSGFGDGESLIKSD